MKTTAENLSPAEIIREKRKKVRSRNFFYFLIIKIFAVSLAVFLFFSYVFGVSVIQGNSMNPNFKDGDLVLTYRIGSNYSSGDIVIFNSPTKKECVKRVVAIEGDTVEISESGKLLVNGGEIPTETYYDTFPINEEISYPYTVPENKIFVLGDNRVDSVDSREYGAISDSSVKGTVITILRRREF